jgi:hypothetical protein
MTTHILNVLYGQYGTIVVKDNNTAVVREDNQPHMIIPLSKLTTYIEKLGIHSTSNGAITLGVWDSKDPL